MRRSQLELGPLASALLDQLADALRAQLAQAGGLSEEEITWAIAEQVSYPNFEIYESRLIELIEDTPEILHITYPDSDPHSERDLLLLIEKALGEFFAELLTKRIAEERALAGAEGVEA